MSEARAARLPRTDRSALFSLFCYALAIGLASGSNFLTAPLLLSLLGQAGFARWALVEPLILTLIPVAGFGINYGLMHAIAQGGGPRRAIGRLVPFFLGASALVAAAAAAIALPGWGLTIALLSAAIVLTEGAIGLFVAYWRSCNRPGLFALVEGGRAALVVLMLAAAWMLAPMLVHSVDGYMGLRGIVGVAAVLLALVVIRPIGPGDRGEAVAAMRFGLPIVGASMLVAMTTTIDRYAVAQFATVAAISSYVAHVKLVQVLGSALTPFFTWFAPVAIRRLPEGEAAHPFFTGSVYAFQTVNGCATLGMWFLAPLVWGALFGSVPFDATLFAILLVGQMLFALGNPVSIGTLRPGKTWHALRATAITLAVTTMACIGLGAVMGTTGVALGRAVGLAAYTATLGYGTVRDLGLRYPWGRMALQIGLVVAVMATSAPWLRLANPWVAVGSAAASCILLTGLSLLLWQREKRPAVSEIA